MKLWTKKSKGHMHQEKERYYVLERKVALNLPLPSLPLNSNRGYIVIYVRLYMKLYSIEVIYEVI